MALGAGFLFGGSTGLSYDELQRRRQLSDRLSAQIMGNKPKTALEGVASLLQGAAVGINRYRTDKAIQENTSRETSAYNQILNQLIGGGSTVPDNQTSGNLNPNANAMPMPGAASEMSAGNPMPADVSQNGSTFSPFIDTVKTGIKTEGGNTLAVTNPYGLAAVAATGRAESGWSPKNAGGAWSDPSESGQAGMAGGVMSWRADRLQKLRSYAAAKGEQGNGSPQTQAEFFLQEDPQLVASLNAAKSPEEAQSLMNNAWKFRGYNRPGGEAARRLSYATAYAPQFQSASSQVASLDPSAGMQPASAAIERAAPGSGYVDPTVSAPNYNPGASLPQQQAALPPLPPPQNVATPPSPPQQPVQVAGGGGRPSQFPSNPLSGTNGEMLRLLSSPWLDPSQRSVIQMVLQQQMQAQHDAQQEQTWRAREDYRRTSERSDPAYQLDQDYKRAQLDALKNKTGNRNLINAGDGNLYDPDSQTWIRPPKQEGSSGDAFRFGGSSVEAQALNGLIESGQLTPSQAQQLAAGKQVTGPNGELLFMTPQGIFSQQGGQQSQGQGVDIFQDSQPSQSSRQVPAAQQSAIPLTGPKAPTEGQANAAGFADRMSEAGAVLNSNEAQGGNVWDQSVTNNRYIPDIVEPFLVGSDFQKYDQARRNFINAQLRRESGAVIGQDEFDNANRQYFPQPGDSPEVLEQKRQSRQSAIDSMARSAGPSYQRSASSSAEIEAARDAIKRGAPRDKVIERLRAAGVDATGL